MGKEAETCTVWASLVKNLQRRIFLSFAAGKVELLSPGKELHPNTTGWTLNREKQCL